MHISVNIDIDVTIEEFGALTELWRGIGSTVFESAVIDPNQRPLPDKVQSVSQKPVAKDEEEAEEDTEPTTRMDSNEFHALACTEMKRLSMDKRMASYKLWDAERDNRLPKMSGMMARYGKTNLADMADIFGLQPPLSARTRNSD